MRPSSPYRRAAATLTHRQRAQRAAVLLAWPLALGAAAALLSASSVPLCLFRQLSGHPCPLCGGTHACAALFRGDIPAAWSANPGLMPLLAIAAAYSAMLVAEAACGRRLATPRFWSAAALCGLALLLVAWLIRLGG